MKFPTCTHTPKKEQQLSDISILIVLLAIIFGITAYGVAKLIIDYKLELNNRLRFDSYNERKNVK